MATYSHFRPPVEEPTDFGRRSWKIYTVAKIAAAVGLALAILIGAFLDKGFTFRRFFFGYLVSFSFYLAIALGALFFVLIQHLVRAGWSVNVRRIAENIAGTLPVLFALSAPIFISVILHNGQVYPWALGKSAVDAAHAKAAAGHGAHHDPHAADKPATDQPKTLDALTLEKRPWLNPLFFIVRMFVYFGIWSAISLYYLKHSTQQDNDGDVVHTMKMQKYAAPSLALLGITLTVAALDLLMSLDPHWYSTIFGVYFFAGGAVSFFASMILIITLMKRAGFFTESINEEHYHDLGKFMFGFVFFWGYIAFSQYMLLWYANLPETTTWLARRGATTAFPTEQAIQALGYEKAWAAVVPDGGQQWRFWAILLLLGKFVIPFAGLLSRHIKRNIKRVTFWAVWLLVFQWVDLQWIVIPELRKGFSLNIIDLLTFIGIGGVVVAAWIRLTAHHKLRPVNDPRTHESAVFMNV